MRRRSGAASAAILASTALLAAACGGSAKSDNAASPSSPTASAASSGTPALSAPAATAATAAPSATATPAALTYSAAVPTISDGTATVLVDHQAVTFPGPVSDAVWSPNGTHLAYVDGDGNIAVARPDGTGVRVLTKAGAGIKRARPTWLNNGQNVYFSELRGGHWTLKSVITGGGGGDGGAAQETGVEQDWRWDPYGPGTFEEPAASVDAVALSLGSDPKLTSSNGPGEVEHVDASFAGQVGTGAAAVVWIGDAFGRGGHVAKFGPGSEPAEAPDGQKFAYVGTNGQIWISGDSGPGGPAAKGVQITFGAVKPTHLAWSADGNRIAYSTPTSVESVPAKVAAGATANPATQESANPGVPAYQRDSAPLTITQLSGTDLVGTAVAVSKAANPTLAKPDDWNPYFMAADQAVVVATGSDVEAEAASTLPGQLLFTGRGGLDPRTVGELDRMFGPCLKPPAESMCAINHTSFTVTIVGTPAEIPLSADAALKAKGYVVRRIDATDPYMITLSPAPKPLASVRIVADDDKASWLAIGDAGAFRNGQATVVTHGSTMPDSVKPFLNSLPKGTKVVTVGTEATAAFAASWSGKPAGLGGTPLASPWAASTPFAFVAPADPTWQAALALQQPVLLADPAALPDPTLKQLDRASCAVTAVIVVGDTPAWQEPLEKALGALFPTTIAVNPQAAGR